MLVCVNSLVIIVLWMLEFWCRLMFVRWKLNILVVCMSGVRCGVVSDVLWCLLSDVVSILRLVMNVLEFLYGIVCMGGVLWFVLCIGIVFLLRCMCVFVVSCV